MTHFLLRTLRIFLPFLALSIIHSNALHINPNNAYAELMSYNLIQGSIRLHLGCGEQHLHGYINIDYPPSNHTTQRTVGADVFANITELNFPANSISEIRNHHFFEHFDRQTALALLCIWHSWLTPGGRLTIETPDFLACIRLLNSNSISYQQQQIVLRHIFGSHEAFWAYHYDGWYAQKFERILSALGFENIQIYPYAHSGYELVPNIVVHAYKKDTNYTQEQYVNIVRQILTESLVNSSETLMLQTWLNGFSDMITTKIQSN